jgi:hypothetical protein
MVQLQLNNPFQAHTRVSTQNDDGVIQTLSVLVFYTEKEWTEDKALFRYERRAIDLGDGAWKCTLPRGKQMNLYFAVNMKDYKADDTNEDEVPMLQLLTQTTTWEDAKKLFILGKTPLKMSTQMRTQGIPMWGEKQHVFIDPEALDFNLGTIPLTRSVAAVDVINNDTANFLLEGALIQNATMTGHLPYDPSKKDEKGVYTTPYLPDNLTWDNWETRVSETATDLQSQIYLYENSLTTETRLILFGKWKGNATGNTSYYPMSFYELKNNVKVKRAVTRNTKFVMSIKAVTGAGFDDRETALAAAEMDMDYDVITWNEQTDELFLDGTNYFYVDSHRNNLLMPRTQGATEELKFKSSFALDDIHISVNDQQEDTLGVLDAHTRFKIKRTTRQDTQTKEEYTCFVITTKKAYQAGENDLKATFNITARRVKFTITVTQINKDEGDWDEGYVIETEVGGE